MTENQFELPENLLSTGQDAPDAHPPLETEVVTRWKIACSGDETRGLGHPRVWMAISPFTGYVDCAYCDKRFVIDREHAHNDH
ncbi:MAG: zinc-finger domain-containing protein [Paracoccus sp. (in: a-proteobacteria)]